MNVQTKIEPAPLTDALALALPTLGGAKKNANNPAFKSKYADLGAVIDAIRPIAEHGIWYIQETHESDTGAMVETFFIGHGEKISAGKVYVPAGKANAHGFGSALTYARRYGLQTAFGLPTEDDVGNAAVEHPVDLAMDSDVVLIEQYCKSLGGTVRGDLNGAYKVDSINKLTAGQARSVVKKLQEKLERKAKAETNANAEMANA